MILSTEIYVVTLFLTIIIGLFVLLNNSKNQTNRLFFLLSLSIGFWILNNILINLTADKDLAMILIRFAVIWVALLPIFFNQLIKSLYFNGDAKYEKNDKFIFYISCVITLILIILNQTNLNIKNISFESWGVDYKPGVFYIILLFYMVLVFGFSLFNILKIILNYKNPHKNQAKFIFIGACITIILAIFTNIICPFLDYGYFNIFGPSTVLIFLLFVAYSITRHNLFNIKVITIEVITVSLWFTILMRTLLAKTLQEKLIEGGILALTLLFGIILINSTLHEFTQRRRIEELTAKLQESYDSIKKLEEKNKG